GDICIAIINASNNCYNSIKPFLDIPNDKEGQLHHVLIYYEFIYFFMHMTNRVAFSEMNTLQHRKLQDFIGPIIASTAIETFSSHWPDELKSRMISEFYENLNTAELQYSESKELWSEGKPFSGNSLFLMLARNVTRETANNENPVTLMTVLNVSVTEFSKMKLTKLIQIASNNL
ncbi:MAG TPA: hypothetical protein VF298_03995, partial [Bacteroidales bacterium]